MATSCHFGNGIWYPCWRVFFFVPLFLEPLDLLFVFSASSDTFSLSLRLETFHKLHCLSVAFCSCFSRRNLDFLLLSRLFSETFPSSASANMPVTPGPGADNVAAGCCIVDCPHGAACCARHPNHFISKDEEASRERILASF